MTRASSRSPCTPPATVLRAACRRCADGPAQALTRLHLDSLPGVATTLLGAAHGKSRTDGGTALETLRARPVGVSRPISSGALTCIRSVDGAGKRLRGTSPDTLSGVINAPASRSESPPHPRRYATEPACYSRNHVRQQCCPVGNTVSEDAREPAPLHPLPGHRRRDPRPLDGLPPGQGAAHPRHRLGQRHPRRRQDRPGRRRVRHRLRRRPQQLLPARDVRADAGLRRGLGVRSRGLRLQPGRLHRARPRAAGRRPDGGLRAPPAHRLRLRADPRRGRGRRAHEGALPRLARRRTSPSACTRSRAASPSTSTRSPASSASASRRASPSPRASRSPASSRRAAAT